MHELKQYTLFGCYDRHQYSMQTLLLYRYYSDIIGIIIIFIMIFFVITIIFIMFITIIIITNVTIINILSLSLLLFITIQSYPFISIHNNTITRTCMT